MPRTFITLLFALLSSSSYADSVAPKAADNSIAAEMKSFKLAEGYKVSLFASEKDQISNPIAMRWGPKGRLWVLCSLVYPQIVPTEKANDKLYILEDRNNDGKADHTTVWLNGLDMPTGFAIGNGGVYIGEGSDLVFWKDTDGDDRADQRELIFTGFGTGDTHQNINSFTWSPDGQLYFCQGLHCFSRVETPWGITRLDEHGVWQFRPNERRLFAFRGGSGQNPWGIAFGQWGEPFIKGNNTELSELLPVMVPTDHFQRPLDIGRTKIKSMICEIVDSPAMPEDLQGDILIAGYFAHVVDRLDMTTDGSGHKGTLQAPLLSSSHRSFRPVDIQTGPDGAIYVADWFNPIIGHYQASLRHPDRDEAHGRIWRITAKEQKLAARADLSRMALPVLFERMGYASLKERERIRIELSNRSSAAVISAANGWRQQGEPSPRKDYEALNVLAWHGLPASHDLKRSEHPMNRALCARLVSRFPEHFPTALKTLVRDSHPRVRLEAVVAASYWQSPEAITIALEALDLPVDRFMQAALIQTTHALRPTWWPAFLENKITFKRPEHLAFALQQASGKQALATVRGMVTDPELDDAVSDTLMILLAQIGKAADVPLLLERGSDRPEVLSALADQAELRDIKPKHMHEENFRTGLRADPNLAIPFIRLVGAWDIQGLRLPLKEQVTDPSVPKAVRVAAVAAWAKLEGAPARKTLQQLAEKDQDADLRFAAIKALHPLHADSAASLAAKALRTSRLDEEVKPIIAFFLGHPDAQKQLVKALKTEPIPPDAGIRIRNAMGAIGSYLPELDAILHAESKQATGLPTYSAAYVAALAKEVKISGDPKKGAQIYQQPALSCFACHKVGEAGGVLGPELTAVGAGLPVELIIEAVLWPKRQVKEGFMASSLTLKDGRTISGYIQSDTADRIVIRNAASGLDEPIAPGRIATRADAGTIMPPGLTAGLSREELRDLIRYLSELKL